MHNYWIAEYHPARIVIVCSPMIKAIKNIREDNLGKYLFREPPTSWLEYERQHAFMCSKLKENGITVVDIMEIELDDSERKALHKSPNMIFTRDSAICLPYGGIILRMATNERSLEPNIMESVYRTLSIPIIAHIPPGMAVEGGDIIFFDTQTLLIGYGPRTSIGGIEYLANLLLSDDFDTREIVAIKILPERINLDGVLMPLSKRSIMADMSALNSTVIIYGRNKKEEINFLEYLKHKGIKVFDISRREGYMLATNVIHIGQGKMIAYAHNNETNAMLQTLGYNILKISGDELVKGSGGPRCMTNIIRYPKASCSPKERLLCP